MRSRHFLFLTCAICLTACTVAPNTKEGQYWQRVNTSDTFYENGPKAQEMLNRDIGRCVVELKELEDLGGVAGKPILADTEGKVLDPDMPRPPQDDQPTYSAQLPPGMDYQDFDSCMKAKGWERVYAAGENTLNTSHIRVRD